MKVSVIIPCYNHGVYIQEAVDSVMSFKDYEIEVIILDDGSTDEFTINKLAELKESGLNVLRHNNAGLAFTRNRGIDLAKGKYILPLDADNKITHDYIRKGVRLLDTNEYDIVYSKPFFFGDDIEDRKFVVKPFNGLDLIFGNYIDACAIFRKEVWTRNQGYDENMPFSGNEDWEFWLKSFLTGFRFIFIDENLYYYRVLKESMLSKTLLEDKNGLNHKYIAEKHAYEIVKTLKDTYYYSQMYQDDIGHPLRSSFKYLYRFFKSL